MVRLETVAVDCNWRSTESREWFVRHGCCAASYGADRLNEPSVSSGDFDAPRIPVGPSVYLSR